MQNTVRRRKAAQIEAKNSRFRHKMNGLITRLFCAERLSFLTVGYGCLYWGIRSGSRQVAVFACSSKTHKEKTICNNKKM